MALNYLRSEEAIHLSIADDRVVSGRTVRVRWAQGMCGETGIFFSAGINETMPGNWHTHFATWQKLHPEDPLGSASQAGGYLFEECYRQGVLTSEFFLNNKRFLGKIPLKPDAALRTSAKRRNWRSSD